MCVQARHAGRLRAQFEELQRQRDALQTEADFVARSKLERRMMALQKQIDRLAPPADLLGAHNLLRMFGIRWETIVVATVRLVVVLGLVALHGGSGPFFWVPWLPFLPSSTGLLWVVVAFVATMPVALHGDALLDRFVPVAIATDAAADQLAIGEAFRRNRAQAGGDKKKDE
jgi:hypothetical protein